jgi:hypothetical protein
MERTALGMRHGWADAQLQTDKFGGAEVNRPFRIEDLSTEELSALARIAALAHRTAETRSRASAACDDGRSLPCASPG